MKSVLILVVSFVALSSATSAAATHVLVVCPAEFRAALAPWEEFRRGEGHELQVIDVPENAVALRDAIRKTAAGGRLKCVVLVGDAPVDERQQPRAGTVTIPTNYIPAKINVRWGSEPTIATDWPYADLNDDGAADLSIGRIPADTAAELSVVVARILRYEREAVRQPWERRVSAIAGAAGFSPLVDAMIETAGQQLMNQALPAGYLVNLQRANTITPATMLNQKSAVSGRGRETLRRQLSDGCLAWIYLGHGDRTELDFEAGPRGPQSLLSVDHVGELHCHGRCPLAVLMTCSAGAFDAQPDCLAEKLLVAEDGPVAVVAASRVSLPYGNTIYGYELLRASLTDRPATLGEAMMIAHQRVLKARPDDTLRTSIETMSISLSPLAQRSGVAWGPEDLAAERREHGAMYHLLGDPLMKWRRPQPISLAVASETSAGSEITVDSKADFDGECLLELSRPGGNAESASTVLASVSQTVKAGAFRLSLGVPHDANGSFVLRAYLAGANDSAVGGAKIVVRPAVP